MAEFSKRNFTTQLACLALAVLAYHPAHAARNVNPGNNYLTEEDLLGDIPVITGASHFPQKISNTPTAVTIIDRKMIAASGAMTVTDLFRLVPGFQTYQPSGSFPMVNYHSLPNHFPGSLEVKVDGRSVYESFLNTVAWSTLGLELEDIDYIEVVRGPNAPADGANSFNGSINIVTRSPLSYQGTSVRASAGDLDTRNLSLMHSAAAEDFSFRLTAGYQSNDGFPDYLVDNTDDSGTVDDGLKTRNLAFRGVWTPTLFDTIDLQLGYSEGDMPFGPGSNGQDPGQIIPWEMESTYQYINWQRQLDSNNTIQVLFYHNKLALDASVSYGLFSTEVGVPPSIFYPGAQDFIISYDGDSYNERYDLELRHSGKLTNQLHFSWGAATRRDEAKSQFYFTQNDPIHEHSQRLFANLEAQILQQLTINGGVILEQSDTAGKHHSQRVSANYHLNNHNTLRLGYSNGSKAPSLLQANEYRTLTEAGNTYTIDRMAADNQKEERLEAFEIGYYANLLHNTLSIDIKLFKERNSDLLEDVRDRTYPNIFDTGVNFRDNVIDIETSGVEAQINYTPTQSWLISAQMSNQNINGIYIRKINPTSTWDLDESAPQRIGNLLIAHDFKRGYAASINYYYQSAVDWQNGGESESFDRIDLRLAKQFDINNTRLKTELIAQNLLDEDYVDFENYNIFEARYYARITIDF